MDNNHQQHTYFPSQKQALLVIIITMVIINIAGLFFVKLGFSRNSVLFIGVLTIVPVLLFVIIKRFSPIQIFRLRPINRNIIITSIAIGFALTILTDEVDRVIQLFFPMPEIILADIKELLVIKTFNDFFIVFLTSVILAAVCEELLFRGFLQTSLEHTFDITKAIMLTAIIFAISHLIPWWTIQIMLFGIFLGILSWKSNSIIPSIIVHLINNGTALLFNNIDETYFNWYFWKNHVDPFIIGLAGLTLIFGLKLFYRYCDEFSKQKSRHS